MSVAAVLCLCAAAAIAAQGAWSLTRPFPADYRRQVLRGVAPIQLAAAVMLGAGGVVGLSAELPLSAVVLVVCVAVAVVTVVAGCWQSAKAVLLKEQRTRAVTGTAPGCGESCATCTLFCRSADESVAAEVDRMGGQ
ncbi:MAG: hypothetical protein AB7G47_16305 [Mycolicibacterium sp.]|uniref:hypothetical protein n=1 Tax=Mycolicibacterium sp. TaxID=2320850 RepID=UPI003D0AE353